MKKILLTATFLASIALTFTSIYSFGYLLAIGLVSYFLPQLWVFRTRISRILLSSFALLAIIPIVGLAAWVIHLDDLPVLNLIGLYAFTAILYRGPMQGSTQKIPFFDKLDAIAIATALLPIAIICVSFFGMTPNRSASLFQLASEGWDNGSHIQMIQSLSKSNGFAYGKKNSYPQAWHLSTANFVNGFGKNYFLPQKPITTMAAYMAASLAWMVATVYIFVVAIGRIYQKIAKKSTLNWVEVVPIAIMSLCFQIVVIYPSLIHGFPNYIATILYAILVIMMVLETKETESDHPYLMMILFGTMSVLTWFLVFPAIALTILLAFLLKKSSYRDSLVAVVRDWRILFVLAGGLLAMLLQILIFQKYSHIGGDSQLNTGTPINPFTSTIGVFIVNQILFGITFVISILFCLSSKISHDFRRSIGIFAIPWVILAFGIYVYQNVTVGFNSYYMSKVFGISFMVIGLIFIPAAAIWLQKLSLNRTAWSAILSSLILVGILIIGTGQSLDGLNKLFQHNARTPYSVAVDVVHTLPEAVKGHTTIMALTAGINSDGSSQDRHGMLEQRVLNKNPNCSYYITRVTNPHLTFDQQISTQIRSLGKCADKLAKKNKTITVIASPDTYNKIRDLYRPNIKLLLVK